MPRLTKRIVDTNSHDGAGDSTILWDSELRGFGVRLFASGAKKFILQYRTQGGQQRRMSLGAYGPLTVERARELARIHLGTVAEGGDPAGLKRQQRDALSVADLCDRYVAAAEQGLMLGRRGTPKKASTLYTDKGRIERHIKPLLGRRPADSIRTPDVEAFKTAVAIGRTAADVRTKKFGRAIVTGGQGTSTRTLGLLGAIFQWGMANGLVTSNPVRGVRRFADRQRKALLTPEHYADLGKALRDLAELRGRDGQPRHHRYGLACLRFIALTGLRRGEAENLRWVDIDRERRTIVIGDSKTGESLRPLSNPALDVIDTLPRISDHVFPAGPGGKPYAGLPKLWNVVRAAAKEPHGQSGPLDNISIHSLRHSFAGVAEESGASLPTVAALLGHRLGGVTAGYILKRVDRPLVAFADQVASRIERMMGGQHEVANIISLSA